MRRFITIGFVLWLTLGSASAGTLLYHVLYGPPTTSTYRFRNTCSELLAVNADTDVVMKECQNSPTCVAEINLGTLQRADSELYVQVLKTLSRFHSEYHMSSSVKFSSLKEDGKFSEGQRIEGNTFHIKKIINTLFNLTHLTSWTLMDSVSVRPISRY